MGKKAYLFYGPPGSGKGTQTRELEKLFENKGCKSVSMGMGAELRKLVDQDIPAAEKTNKILHEGTLVPSFLSTYIWTHFLLTQKEDVEVIILDGIIRQLEQVTFMYDATKFLDIEVTIILLNVEREELVRRLIARGRKDDTEEIIDTRIETYESETAKCVDEWESKGVKILRMPGDKPIEEVTKDISEQI